MNTEGEFRIPAGLTGRFAVVKLWPGIKTAEDECIARLKIAAHGLGLECVEVHADGRWIDAPERQVSPQDVDFVLHLHYDTPKRYDAFSFVALWNPIRFYHEWGYDRTSRNLTSHDDFISCLSPAADDHVARMVRGLATHLPPAFQLFHSTADVVHGPSAGDGKLFYAGINWEALGGGKSRHQEVLKRLDQTGYLRIYGPTLFQGVQVWAGYESYVKEVPFDGVSMLDEIARAGIALVLSSQAHKDSGLMSNRLFESIAAGALVICDENPFAARHFGDTLLYVDSRKSEDRIEQDILRHLEWARSNPASALAMIASAQRIFREKFTLTGNLRTLYKGLPGRKRQLSERQNPAAAAALRVRLWLLMPVLSAQTLQAHLESARAQTYASVAPALVFDAAEGGEARAQMERAVQGTGIELIEARFTVTSAAGVASRRNLGAVVLELLQAGSHGDALMFVAPNERLLSNHVAVLAGALQRDPQVQCAATAAILLDGDAPVHSVHELLDFGHAARRSPTGFGRFIFRTSSIAPDVAIALRHLDSRPLAALVASHDVAQQLPATVLVDTASEFPPAPREEHAENAVIRDFSSAALRIWHGFGPAPVHAPPAPVEMPPMTLLQLVFRFMSPRWLRVQMHALRREGPRARFQVLRRKLGLA